MALTLAFQHRLQVEIAVGNVHRQNPVGVQMAEINLHRLMRQQVDRNRIAGKCVHRQDVEVLVRFLLEREARIAHG